MYDSRSERKEFGAFKVANKNSPYTVCVRYCKKLEGDPKKLSSELKRIIKKSSLLQETQTRVIQGIAKFVIASEITAYFQKREFIELVFLLTFNCFYFEQIWILESLYPRPFHTKHILKTINNLSAVWNFGSISGSWYLLRIHSDDIDSDWISYTEKLEFTRKKSQKKENSQNDAGEFVFNSFMNFIW